MSDKDQVEDDAARIARRSILKGAAAVPLVWAAPAISSVGSRALAASVNPLCNNDCENTCAGQHICGDEGLYDICACTRNTEGDCFCWANAFCSQTPACDDSSSCLPGWSCVPSCCGYNACFPPCGTILSSDAGGPTGAKA
jgi:hypothetical protein